MTNVTSEKIESLYTKTSEDDYVYKILSNSQDIPGGINIIRRYKKLSDNLSDKRMFIRFYLVENNGKFHVQGGVDMVINKINVNDHGWTVETPKGGLIQRPTNFNLSKSDGILFDIKEDKIFFKNNLYDINSFVDILEKNHLRDMFLLGRLKNYLKIGLLYSLFYLSDSRFKKSKSGYFIDDESLRLQTKEKGAGQEIKNPDPLFHYFEIYKNLLGLAILILLFPLFYLSLHLPGLYFTVTNPFLLFFSLFFLFLLEKLSKFLSYVLLKTKFVSRVTLSTLEMKGKLKK